MSEKTIDELEAELSALKKANLEKQIAEEKAKVDEAEKLEKEKEEEELRNKIREEEHSKILADMNEKSTVKEENPETLERKSKAEAFKQNMVKKYGLTGKTYEDRIRDLVDGGQKW